ncbi:unnamed protein product [Anisakis simplex]|uniref:Mucin-22-like n=1 Tax=Anisakis simplex TaxID=6269 RepID=A0A0M3K4E2_ANISI|nr:unnamed protein product [Anisakis simplex]
MMLRTTVSLVCLTALSVLCIFPQGAISASIRNKDYLIQPSESAGISSATTEEISPEATSAEPKEVESTATIEVEAETTEAESITTVAEHDPTEAEPATTEAESATTEAASVTAELESTATVVEHLETTEAESATTEAGPAEPEVLGTGPYHKP